MRSAAFMLSLILALSSATANARATTLFNEGPGTSDFSVFPGWQRVMAHARADIGVTPQTHQRQEPLQLYGPQQPPQLQKAQKPQKPQQSIKPTADCGQSSDCLVKRWKSFIADTAKLPRSKQLDAVNRWANSYAYVEDWGRWGLPDYWESPREFLAAGGDCEDFAIIKYFTLIQLGFPPKDMRIVVVNDTNLEIFHAVLAVRQSHGEPILLDNQARDLVPMSAAPQYQTIYSLNESGWWMANAPTIMISKNNVSKEFQTASGSAD